MKVVYIITSRNESILHIGSALARMGIDGVMVPADEFSSNCSYFEHKLYKWGYRKYFESYVQERCRKIKETIEMECPDAVLFVNSGYVRYMEEDVRKLASHCCVAMFLVDSIKGDDEEAARLAFPGNHVFVYEPGDVEFLGKYGIEAAYCPVGYGADYCMETGKSKDLDVFFVGTPTGDRREYLNAVAKAGGKRGWRLLFAGPFYEKRYFWKPLYLKVKYGALCRYVQCGELSSQEVAEFYRRSKICLNIQGNEGDNLNPRTFEIMATGAFELISRHKDYLGLIEPGRDLVDFGTPEELVEKISYYLEHEKERKAIAANGYRQVKDKFRMEDSLSRILAII